MSSERQIDIKEVVKAHKRQTVSVDERVRKMKEEYERQKAIKPLR